MNIVDGNSVDVFFSLLQSGLWEKDIRLSRYGAINFRNVYKLAEEQSVIGLIAAGLEHVEDVKVPQEVALRVAGQTMALEKRNQEMNAFIAKLISEMQKADIYALVVKGQGVARCYERPLWRSSGDVDFYLNDINYFKVKDFFRPRVAKFDPDNDSAQHINMHYGDWVVEIHANQHCSLSLRANSVLDKIHEDLFNAGNVRIWNNGGTIVNLPSPDDDVLLVFTHFLNHFYKGGLGVRQICDWCRLLWTYRREIDIQLLEKRLKSMGLMPIWKGFASFAVRYLGMPESVMPFYLSDLKWKLKADRICSFIIEVGNFGHNRDYSYFSNKSKFVRKVSSFGRRCGDMLRHTSIFPLESLRFFPYMVYCGLKAYSQGE